MPFRDLMTPERRLVVIGTGPSTFMSHRCKKIAPRLHRRPMVVLSWIRSARASPCLRAPRPPVLRFRRKGRLDALHTTDTVTHLYLSRLQ